MQAMRRWLLLGLVVLLALRGGLGDAMAQQLASQWLRGTAQSAVGASTTPMAMPCHEPSASDSAAPQDTAAPMDSAGNACSHCQACHLNLLAQAEPVLALPAAAPAALPQHAQAQDTSALPTPLLKPPIA